MFLGKTVLVASDLTEGSDNAVKQASAWAEAFQGELVACHIVPNALHNNVLFPQELQNEALNLVGAERLAEQLLIDQVAQLTGRGTDSPTAPGEAESSSGSFTVAIDNGSPDAGIVECAEQLAVGLVVVGVGHTGRVGESLLGKVSSRVVRYAPCPVLVARAEPGVECIVVATDFSERSIPAVQAGAEIAKLRKAKITLLHCLDLEPNRLVSLGLPFGGAAAVVPSGVLAEVHKNAEATLRETAERYSIEGDYRVVEGNAAEAIVHAATDLKAELIVLGTSGRTGLARLALGSTAEQVAHAAPCSVLVVRAQ